LNFKVRSLFASYHWYLRVGLGILNFSSFLQSLLLSKALKMQQDDEDRKSEIVVKDFEDKIKKLEDTLKEKDDLLQLAEGSLPEAQAQNKKLSKELKEAQTILEENSSRFNRETEALNMTLKVEAQKNMRLSEALRTLRDKCFNFASQ
jgi:septal ring factor EnvC (AmiA/AmiB activator)